MNDQHRTMGADTAVSIVGIGVRLPGAETADEFWQLILSGQQTFRAPTEHERELSSDFAQAELNADYRAVTSTAAEVDTFDADYFGIPRHEASLLDPQQRFLIEAAWQALEDSGHAGDFGAWRVGVFASMSPSTYLSGPLTSAGLWDPSDPSYGVLVGNDKDFASARLSYLLGLGGPSMNVQTACSSSLVATHEACRALQLGECDLAVVVGSSISLAHLSGYVARTGSIFSPSGNCRPFDKAADGTGKGNGAAAVVLRRSADARDDLDRVYAEVVGSAVTNDGSARAGFAAPGVDGQSSAMSLAWARSGLDTRDASFVETHGTGTYLGDRIEARSMQKAFGDAETPCYLGSLKATMGHLDAAAGVASLAKTALAVHHGMIPPMAGRSSMSGRDDLSGTRFAIPEQPVPVDELRAGVSSFGMGGTNAHVVLVPPTGTTALPHVDIEEDVQLEVFGPDEARARAAAHALAEQLRQDPEVRLANVAHALIRGRRRDRFVVSVIARSAAEAAAALAVAAPVDLDHRADTPTPGVRLPHEWVTLPLTRLNRTRFWVRSEPNTPITSAVDEVAEVGALMGHLLETDPLEADDDFFLAGGDSLLGIDLLAQLEQELGVQLEYTDLEAARTPAGVVRHARHGKRLDAERASTVETSADRTLLGDLDGPQGSERSLVRLTRGEGPEVFLVHPAGGTTSCYVTVCQQLRDQATFWGVNFPGELAGQRPSIRSLATRYIRAMRQQQPEGPYRLVGYSFGGNLAVEMTLQLEAAGEEVSQLVLIDAHPPHAYIGGECGPEDYLDAFPHLLSALLGTEVEFSSQGPFRSPQEVMDALRSPQLSETVRGHMASFFDVWCDNHSALKGWLPDAAPRCPVVILEATAPEPPEVLQMLDIKETLAREWARYLSDDVVIVPIEGDHYSIFRDEAGLATMRKALSDVCR